jgi:hypothetical protein
MAEAVISIAIVGTMLTAALSVVGAAARMRTAAGDRAMAAMLAEDLMSEIVIQAYAEPGEASPSIGANTSESLSGNRLNFDDVDDYNGWSASPPKARDGTSMSHLTGWTRSVSVIWVVPGNPTMVIGAETRAKRIVVTVTRNGTDLATLVAIRTKSGEWER